MANQIVVSAGAKVRNLQDVIIGTSGVLTSLGFDVANGVPRLDVNGKILVSQLPNSVMEYKGTWSAATNTPTLANGTGNQGDVYLCNVAGTVDFGAGAIAFVVGDQVIYSGSIWQRASGATGTVTSVAITESGDSLNITGSPITTSGTINIGFNGTNLQYVNGAGNLTTFPTLITSIGLSMPSAFSVANSPLTANGTIAVTGAGVASQYIRGDGTLADFPSSGGGSSVSYYLNGSINQGTIGGVTYYEMNKVPVIGAGTDFSRGSNGYIASFLTDANDPALLEIPAGNWNFETYLSASSGGGSPTFYIELYKYDGTTFTLIASNSAFPKLINDGTSIEAYFSALAVPQTSLTLTDRLAVRIYVTTAGRTITLHTENSHLCQVITTFSTGLTALNGLTAQVQYFQVGTSGSDFNISSTTATHTFNLPTASAANRGALSSADWTTFNNKQSALTNPVTGTGTTNTLPKFTAASTIGNSNITDTGSLITLGSNTRLNGSLWMNTTQTNMGFANYVNMTGSTSVYGQMNAGIIQSDATVNGFYYDTFAQTAAASFTLGNLVYYRAYQGTFGAGSTVTLQTGFEVNNTLIGATTNYGFRGRIPSGTNRWNIYMDGTANNYLAGSLGIGTTNLTGVNLRIGKTITGSTLSYGIYCDTIVQSDVTSAAIYYGTRASTAAASFTLGSITHYNIDQLAFGAGSTVTNQVGFLVNSSMTGATNNYGFYGNIASGTNRWNLYMAGTAANYMAGQLLIGTTSSTFLLDVNGTTRLQGITTISRNDSGSGSSLNIVNTSTTGANNIRIGQDLANNTLGFGYHPSGASTYNSLIPNTAYAFALSGASQLSFNTTTATQAITFSTNDWNEKMRIFGNGNVNIGGGNTPTDIASAKLAITSTTQGFLPPRMTSAQRTAISSPAEGLIVVQTDGTQGLYLYIGAAWHSITML
jgi:hypothetical protein